jgi:hypothetical protein
MTHRSGLAATLALLTTVAWPATARGQFATIDPANILQVTQIVETTLKHLEQAMAIREAVERAGRRLSSMDPYRTVGLQATRHQVAQYPYGGDVLAALNDGDPSGSRYLASLRTLRLSPAVMASLTPDARRAIEAAQAGIQIADSINGRAIQVIGGNAGFGREVGRALAALEADILDPADAKHGTTAVLDKLAGAGLIHAVRPTPSTSSSPR